MSMLNRGRARLLVCIASLAALGALAFAPAAGAATNYGNTYLALGDSLAYGYHAAQFAKEYPAVNPANYNKGYVDFFGAKVKETNPKVTTINDGCPGETSETMIAGSGKAGFCAGGPSGSRSRTRFCTTHTHGNAAVRCSQNP